jgi:hypothetical protein
MMKSHKSENGGAVEIHNSEHNIDIGVSSSVRFFGPIWTDRDRDRLPVMARPKKPDQNRKKPV